MKRLKPALEARGYELAVFHTTGMGGRAFEPGRAGPLCRGDGLQPAGAGQPSRRLLRHLGPRPAAGAGRAGVPQIVAPGATDMVDFPAWGRRPRAGRPPGARAQPADRVGCIDGRDAPRPSPREIGQRLARPPARTALLLPTARHRSGTARPAAARPRRPGRASSPPVRESCGAHTRSSSSMRTSTTPPSPTPRWRCSTLGGRRPVPPPGARHERFAGDDRPGPGAGLRRRDQPHAVRDARASPRRRWAWRPARSPGAAPSTRERRAVARHAGRPHQRARLLAGAHARGGPPAGRGLGPHGDLRQRARGADPCRR
jgi:hypothetical protein